MQEEIKETFEQKAQRALERARAFGVREFSMERSFGEFDYLGRADYVPSDYDGAEILKEIINLRL